MSSLTQKWLRQNLQPYQLPDVVYAHVDALLSRHPTIRPKTDVYSESLYSTISIVPGHLLTPPARTTAYDDGRSQLLLCLHGLLPISFRGAAYNIPIAIWVPREYPRIPPLAYVVPTSDMLVRAGPEMDVSGRSFLQYLRHWERKSEVCFISTRRTWSRADLLLVRDVTSWPCSKQCRMPSRASLLYMPNPRIRPRRNPSRLGPRSPHLATIHIALRRRFLVTGLLLRRRARKELLPPMLSPAIRLHYP